MISHLASPRTPRETAEHMMRRARVLDDQEMMDRAQEVMSYAEEQEAKRPKPSPKQVDHSRLEPRGSLDRKVSEVSQVFGFTVGMTVVTGAFFGAKVALVGVAVCGTAALTAYVAYRLVRHLRG